MAQSAGFASARRGSPFRFVSLRGARAPDRAAPAHFVPPTEGVLPCKRKRRGERRAGATARQRRWRGSRCDGGRKGIQGWRCRARRRGSRLRGGRGERDVFTFYVDPRSVSASPKQRLCGGRAPQRCAPAAPLGRACTRISERSRRSALRSRLQLCSSPPCTPVRTPAAVLSASPFAPPRLLFWRLRSHPRGPSSGASVRRFRPAALSVRLRAAVRFDPRRRHTCGAVPGSALCCGSCVARQLGGAVRRRSGGGCLPVGLLEAGAGAVATELLGLRAAGVGHQEGAVVGEEDVLDLVLRLLVDKLLVEGDDALGDGLADGVGLRDLATTAGADADVDVRKALLAEEQEGLEDLEAEELGLDQLKRRTWTRRGKEGAERVR